MAEYHENCEKKDAIMLNLMFGDKIKFEFTEQGNRIDFRGSKINNPNCCYEGEIKGYFKADHPRYSYKCTKINKPIESYRIDFIKLYFVWKRAIDRSIKENRPVKPLLVVFFEDKCIVWDLNKTDWVHTASRGEGDKGNNNYGKSDNKEQDVYAFLNLKDGYSFEYTQAAKEKIREFKNLN